MGRRPMENESKSKVFLGGLGNMVAGTKEKGWIRLVKYLKYF